MDCIILAGGYGTRLRDVWDGPKCLVPVNGEPIIKLLINQISKLPSIETILLVLGHKHRQVTDWFKDNRESVFKAPYTIVEDDPCGTAVALRYAFKHFPLADAPTLIMNGDTLPKYDLATLLNAHTNIIPSPYISDAVAAWYQGKHAGAAVLSPKERKSISTGRIPDFEFYLAGMHHYEVSGGYLDVGTPENFHRAQNLNVATLKEVK